MKKILVICLMVVLSLSLSLSALAAPGNFVNSPSGNPAPSIVGFNPSDDSCNANLVITAYGDRDELPDSKRDLIEQAYDDIVGAGDLTDLNDKLDKLAADKKLDGTKLAVSDLFDLRLTGCDYPDEHTVYEITLDAETLKKFVGLMFLNDDGEWELVENAEALNDGEHLRFSVDSFSPFAIVVNTGAGTPQTGDASMIHLWVAIMAVCAIAIVAIAVKLRKQRAC